MRRVSILSRLAELIVKAHKKGAEDIGLIEDCHILGSTKTEAEQSKVYAAVEHFHIHSVELAVEGNTIHIRPKTPQQEG